MNKYIKYSYLAILLIALGLLLLRNGCSSEQQAQDLDLRADIKNVILIVVDTLRVDRLGFMGCKLDTTPNLDRLAERSIVFEEVYTPRSQTTSAFTALLTGNHPLTTGVTSLSQQWPEGTHSLVSDIQAAGFYTGGIPANIVIKGELGFEQGFTDYWTTKDTIDDANRITDLAKRALHNAGEHPAFVMLHTWDTHLIFTPDTEMLEALGYPASYQGALASDWDSVRKYRTRTERHFTNEDLIKCRALYEAEIRGLDRDLEQFFEWLRQNGYWENSLIIVTADHGESLGECHRLAHGNDTEWDCHIPLILHFPDDAGAGKRISGLVELTDIVPTILDLLEIRIPDSIDGMSLLPRMEDSEVPGRSQLVSVGQFWTDPDTGEEIREISIWDGEWRRTVDVLTQPVTQIDYELTPEEKEQLRALGYIQY